MPEQVTHDGEGRAWRRWSRMTEKVTQDRNVRHGQNESGRTRARLADYAVEFGGAGEVDVFEAQNHVVMGVRGENRAEVDTEVVFAGADFVAYFAG